jgi:hypothetical protein
MSLRVSDAAEPSHGSCRQPQLAEDDSVSTLAFAQRGPQ